MGIDSVRSWDSDKEEALNPTDTGTPEPLPRRRECHATPSLGSSGAGKGPGLRTRKGHHRQPLIISQHCQSETQPDADRLIEDLRRDRQSLRQELHATHHTSANSNEPHTHTSLTIHVKTLENRIV